MRYDGGKGTCYAQIINLMPPHRRYIETHLGGGAVMRHKRPALEQVGIERDPAVVTQWLLDSSEHCRVLQGDALEILQTLPLEADTVVYSDPPYHPETRRRARVYKYDYTVKDHERLLDCLTVLPCHVMISGYASPLYERRLAGWQQHHFQVRTRVGMCDEYVWFNFPRPSIPHDDRYLGAGFREREVIRRRQERLRQRIGKLPMAEQAALSTWLAARIAQERAQ
jgi:DNA adenine methylase